MINGFSVLSVLSTFLIFLCTLLVIFLTTIKGESRRSNRILALYFFIYALHISVFFYVNYITLPPVLEGLRDQIMFFSSPLLYLYLLSSIYVDFKWQPKHLWHLLPFVINFCLFLPRFYLVDNEQRYAFLAQYNHFLEAQLSALFAALVTVFYLFLMFRALLRYQRILEASYSNQENFNFRWLLQLTVLLTIIFLVSQVKQLYFYFGNEIALLNTLRMVLNTMVFVFLTWIVLKGMLQPQLFRNIDTKHALFLEGLREELPKPSPQTAIIDQLKDYMDLEKAYMDASLNLQELAEKMQLKPRTLSTAINQELGQHFYDFVNEYRISAAKKLLERQEKPLATIQEIMYEVGFSSKSSFYTEFKKRTGQTPTQYRKAPRT